MQSRSAPEKAAGCSAFAAFRLSFGRRQIRRETVAEYVVEFGKDGRPVAEGLFAGAGNYLRADGRLFLYGPFKRDGKHTALSNAVFDTSLREQDSEWGVRDIADLERLAERAALALCEIVEMPANNLILI